MAIRDVDTPIDDLIPVRNVILSVADKRGLEEFATGLVKLNPSIRLLSTGGTYKTLRGLYENPLRDNLMEIAEYTEFPEMKGGLVKTLHPKIHAGILGERNNPEHQQYLGDTLRGAEYIDMVVVNLYPFEETIKLEGVTFETARGNIDVGGPTMLRGAAKNFLGCAAVCDPADYPNILQEMRENDGATNYHTRLGLVEKVFDKTSQYDAAIRDYVASQVRNNLNGISSCYKFRPGTYKGE